MRKNILKTPEKHLKKNVSSNKYTSPKKLNENEKATLLEVFTLSNEKNTEKHQQNSQNNNAVRTRSKSPFVKQNLEYIFIK